MSYLVQSTGIYICVSDASTGLCFLRTRGIICDGLVLRASKYLWNSSAFNVFFQSNVSVNTVPVYNVISLKYMSLKNMLKSWFLHFKILSVLLSTCNYETASAGTVAI
jgi:hypothetical protein